MIAQEILDLVNARLSGYSNASSQSDILGFINEGKDAVYSILKSLNEEYFLEFSQSSDSNASFYFAPLNTTTREYDLPSDFREIKFVECLTQGYTSLKFVYKDTTTPEFRAARRSANDGPAPLVNPEIMLYTIVGQRKFVLAEYPPTALNLKLWYIRYFPDMELDTDLADILTPFVKKIADYAAKKILLSTQDISMFQAYQMQWREDVIEIAQGAGPRNQADAIFVQDFMSDEC